MVKEGKISSFQLHVNDRYLVPIFSLQPKVCSAQFRNWKLEKYMALEDKITSANKKSPETSIWIQEQLQLEHELSTQQW